MTREYWPSLWTSNLASELQLQDYTSKWAFHAICVALGFLSSTVFVNRILGGAACVSPCRALLQTPRYSIYNYSNTSLEGIIGIIWISRVQFTLVWLMIYQNDRNSARSAILLSCVLIGGRELCYIDICHDLWTSLWIYCTNCLTHHPIPLAACCGAPKKVWLPLNCRCPSH